MRDELFIRGEVPMTKSEVRAVSLSKLELPEAFVLYDVGAGTGSVSIEAALSSPFGRVLAIEKNPEAVKLIEANRDKFGTDRVEIICARAPEGLLKLEKPTHVFIGGSTGGMTQILDVVREKNPHVRVVINAIAAETFAEVIAYIGEHDIDAEIVQVQIAKGKKAGDYHMMMGQNPVYVISFGDAPADEAGGK